MSTPPRTPRLPSRPTAEGDSYTWMGVLWLVIMAGGFFGLVLMIFPINLPVLLGVMVFVGLMVSVHVVLGRWVARHIAETTPESEGDPE